jgi:hypothetical protein
VFLQKSLLNSPTLEEHRSYAMQIAVSKRIIPFKQVPKGLSNVTQYVNGARSNRRRPFGYEPAVS